MYFKGKKHIKATEFHLAAEHLARYVEILGKPVTKKTKS